MYQYIPVHTTASSYHFIPVCTGMYQYIPVHTSTYQYIPVCTGMCWYILVHTTIIYMLFQCWGAAVCAGHHCCDPSISLQHHRRYCQCSLLPMDPQTVLAWPHTVPSCGSSWPHGRQSPPLPLVSGWQLNPYNPIPHKFSKHKASGFPMGCADSA